MINAAGSIPKLCKDSVLIMVDRYKAAIPIAENICASFGNFLRINSSASSTTPRDTTYREIPLIHPFIKYIPISTRAVRINTPPTTERAMVPMRYSAFCFFFVPGTTVSAAGCVENCPDGCAVTCPAGCPVNCPVCCSVNCPDDCSCMGSCVVGCTVSCTRPAAALSALSAFSCCLWCQYSTLLSSSACNCSTYCGCFCILGISCCTYCVKIGSLDCIRYSLACCSKSFALSCCVFCSI